MLYNVLLIIQILVSLGIIGLVLVQHGKGADAGAAFGGGASASGTVFGSKGSGSFLTRLTGILATVFFANSLMLAWLVANPDDTGSESIIPTAVTESAADAPPSLPVGSMAPAAIENKSPDIPK